MLWETEKKWGEGYVLRGQRSSKCDSEGWVWAHQTEQRGNSPSKSPWIRLVTSLKCFWLYNFTCSSAGLILCDPKVYTPEHLVQLYVCVFLLFRVNKKIWTRVLGKQKKWFSIHNMWQAQIYNLIHRMFDNNLW